MRVNDFLDLSVEDDHLTFVVYLKDDSTKTLLTKEFVRVAYGYAILDNFIIKNNVITIYCSIPRGD